MVTVERIGIRELRDTLTTTIRRVRAGEAFEVTHDGVTVAILAPYPSDRIARLIRAGDVTPARPLDRPIRPLPATGEMTASEALEDDRGER